MELTPNLQQEFCLIHLCIPTVLAEQTNEQVNGKLPRHFDTSDPRGRSHIKSHPSVTLSSIE